MSRTHPIADGTHVTQAFQPPSNRTHDGTDFRAARGTPLRASMSGTVRTGTGHARAGTWVEIHAGNTVVGYSHMSSRAVKSGQVVQEGDVIGESGATGRVTGPHLHFYVKRHGGYINPVTWLAESTAPAPAPAPAPRPTATAADPAVKAYQERQNKYGGAGLDADGIRGAFTIAWEAWVKDLQRVLNVWKSDLPDLTTDGDYGARSHDRAREFQRRNYRQVTGIITNADIAYMRTHGSKLADRPRTR